MRTRRLAGYSCPPCRRAGHGPQSAAACPARLAAAKRPSQPKNSILPILPPLLTGFLFRFPDSFGTHLYVCGCRPEIPKLSRNRNLLWLSTLLSGHVSGNVSRKPFRTNGFCPETRSLHDLLPGIGQQEHERRIADALASLDRQP